MSLRKKQKDTERQLIDIVNSRGNDNKCGECGSLYPTWASVNLGILLCGRCSSIHKRILTPKNLSTVKSLTLDSWSHEQIDNLRRIGNKKAKRKWNSKKIPFPYDGDNDVSAVEQYIREKYVLGKFRDDNIEHSDYDDRASRYSNDSIEDNGRRSSRTNRSRSGTTTSGRSRSNSNVIPRLSHRKLTSFESGQYASQASKILSFGYSNRDLIVESLILSNGSIDAALDILEQDAKVNPNEEENPPALPRRPSSNITPTSTAPAGNASGVPTASSGTDEWWNGNNNSVNGVVGANGGQPQIYQYTDPVTGQVSYIDSNGQQYLDPTNPQHQQQILFQQNPQLVAQQTNKNQILSLYNQPNQFTTPVAVPVQPGQPTQQQQQQPQQAQQPQQQQNQQQPFQQQPTQLPGYAQNTGYYQYGQPQVGIGAGAGAGVAVPQFTGFAQPQQQQQQQQFNPYGQPQAPPNQQFGWR
ncbi:putative GTPase activating protein for Arf-domain-containing protein [Scheffersomyces amazonensis]|uniref:putative GTPase activating protein for Arf-domain-containing protein n=1 Tax=Scheffersomyces amazonensis TaxID=1078765 RepID=UPI00315C5B19